MPKKVAETNLIKEFDRQVENLIQKGYSKLVGVTAEDFVKHIEPLKERIRELATQESEAKDGRIPFVIVLKSDLVSTDIAMPLVDLRGTKGFIGMHPVEPNSFKPIEGLQIPEGMAYLLVDIETEKDL